MLWKHNSNELLQGGVLERSRGSMHCPKPKALSGRWSATRCSGCFTGNVHPCNSQWHFFIFFLYSLHTLRSLRLMPFAIRNVMIFASRSLRLWPDQRQDHKHPSDPWLYIYVNIYIYMTMSRLRDAFWVCLIPWFSLHICCLNKLIWSEASRRCLPHLPHGLAWDLEPAASRAKAWRFRGSNSVRHCHHHHHSLLFITLIYINYPP